MLQAILDLGEPIRSQPSGLGLSKESLMVLILMNIKHAASMEMFS
jgi:hypothetical protein